MKHLMRWMYIVAINWDVIGPKEDTKTKAEQNNETERQRSVEWINKKVSVYWRRITPPVVFTCLSDK